MVVIAAPTDSLDRSLASALILLSYFGQDYPGPCGNCDNDLAHAQPPRADPSFPVGARVVSERWGEGTVQHYDGDSVTVLFDEHGYRELYLPVVLECGLLRPARGAARNDHPI